MAMLRAAVFVGSVIDLNRVVAQILSMHMFAVAARKAGQGKQVQTKNVAKPFHRVQRYVFETIFVRAYLLLSKMTLKMRLKCRQVKE